MQDMDIWRTAYVMLKQHGGDAVFEAALRADGLIAKNDFLGATVWTRIGRAIEELERRAAQGRGVELIYQRQAQS